MELPVDIEGIVKDARETADFWMVRTSRFQMSGQPICFRTMGHMKGGLEQDAGGVGEIPEEFDFTGVHGGGFFQQKMTTGGDDLTGDVEVGAGGRGDEHGIASGAGQHFREGVEKGDVDRTDSGAGSIRVTGGNPHDSLLSTEGFGLDFRDATHACDGETEGWMGHSGKVHAEEGERMALKTS